MYNFTSFVLYKVVKKMIAEKINQTISYRGQLITFQDTQCDKGEMSNVVYIFLKFIFIVLNCFVSF